MEVTSYAPGTPSWVDLGSPSVEGAARFYSSLFGWEVEDMGPDAGGYSMCNLGGRPVAGLGPQQQEGVPPYWTTYVSVDDADATTAAVNAAGGTTLVEPMDVFTSGRMAVFLDPTGAPFSLWQPVDHIGAELVNEPGTFCWNELTTRQADAAKAFYGEVFGWEAADQPMGPITYTEWKLDGRRIGGMMPMDDDSWPAEVPSHWMVYFAVDDTDAAVALVDELGGTVSVPPTDIPVGRFSVVSDPYGATFSLIKLTDPAQT